MGTETANRTDDSVDGRNHGRDSGRNHEGDGGGQNGLSRRATLGLLGIGGLAALTGPAAADHGGPHWRRDVDAGGYALTDLGALSTASNQTKITDFAGENLSIDAAGVLNATVTDTRTDVTDDGEAVVTSTETIDAGAGLSATADASGTSATLAVEQGPGSGLDADTVDGLEAAAFAEVDHDHFDEILRPRFVRADRLELTEVGLHVETTLGDPQTVRRGTTQNFVIPETIEFDRVVFDDFEAWDEETNVFTLPPGTWHADLTVTAVAAVDSRTRFGVQLVSRSTLRNVASGSGTILGSDDRQTISVSGLFREPAVEAQLFVASGGENREVEILSARLSAHRVG
jgi:hypothetical protein